VTETPSRRLELPAPVLLELRGPDAVRYLNGQVTQDVRLANDQRALTACVTDAKGKFQFRVLIHTHEGALRVSCDHDGAGELFARLDRYLIADDAVLEEITSAWRRVHVTGAEPTSGGYAVSVNRIGVPGWDVWLPADEADPVDELKAWPVDVSETMRITAGIPAWGSELTAGMLPPEAGLDRSDISYAKGCYIGQEVISRIKSAGKVNRRLMRLGLPGHIACAAGDLLVDAEGREAGVLTSVAPHCDERDDGPRALLGYLKRTAAEGAVFLERMRGQPVAVIAPA